MTTRRSKPPFRGDGFVHELMPLVKSGFVILRSILDILIDRIEEAENSREIDVRREIFESIVDALEAEIETIRKNEGTTPAADSKVEVLEAVISVLLREMEELDERRQKGGKRPHKVKIQ